MQRGPRLLLFLFVLQSFDLRKENKTTVHVSLPRYTFLYPVRVQSSHMLCQHFLPATIPFVRPIALYAKRCKNMCDEMAMLIQERVLLRCTVALATKSIKKRGEQSAACLSQWRKRATLPRKVPDSCSEGKVSTAALAQALPRVPEMH